jgi:hypothetical protein
VPQRVRRRAEIPETSEHTEDRQRHQRAAHERKTNRKTEVSVAGPMPVTAKEYVRFQGLGRVDGITLDG